MTYCKECLRKQQKINELEEQIASLKGQLCYQERTAKEGFFGSSTPSSKLPVKANSSKEQQRNRGGAKVGHKGHGRASIRQEDADKVETIALDNTCPACGAALEDKGSKTRTVMDCHPVKMEKVVYRLQRKRCPKCKKVITARPPGVLAKCLYSNQLLAHVAVQHYIYGNTLGQIEKQTGVGYSSLVEARHPAIQKIQDIFREKPERLYHWADDRNVPADNNRAERELRPLVIARKISFGSQSDAGAKTREILMTVLHTLGKRTSDVTIAFKCALDKLAEQPAIEPYDAIFGLDSS